MRMANQTSALTAKYAVARPRSGVKAGEQLVQPFLSELFLPPVTPHLAVSFQISRSSQ
jgi:hypothetical protein